MPTHVTTKTKCILAKHGANKLFGDDVDARRQLAEIECISLFDKVWLKTLKDEIEMAVVCDSLAASERLTDKQREYFDFDQTHRSFRLLDLNIELIAQIHVTSDRGNELTQLWKVSSSDTQPKTLYVRFETVEERNGAHNAGDGRLRHTHH